MIDGKHYYFLLRDKLTIRLKNSSIIRLRSKQKPKKKKMNHKNKNKTNKTMHEIWCCNLLVK